MTTIRNTAVLGAGGVGGCIAAVLAHEGAGVTCVDRPETVEIIRARGLRLGSAMFGAFEVRPEAETRLTGRPEVLFVTTKATHLGGALGAVDPALLDGGIVIPLLNGIEHMAPLRARFGRNVAAANIRIESKVVSPGHIVHTSPFLRITIASDGDIPHHRLDEIAAFLTAHRLDTFVGASEAAVLWDKLARLVGLACTTAATNQPIGFIRKDPRWRGILESVTREACAVANAEGVAVDWQDQMKVLDGVPETLTSSLQRDIAAGRPSELDAIAGAVVRAGRKHGIRCPALENLIKEIEAKS